ncbi:MAG: transglutaminase [Candidatus Marinimicrobia bacterium]|nr:transglutaminase [Candidatus Neomarinimicrobiota bacterium]
MKKVLLCGLILTRLLFSYTGEVEESIKTPGNSPTGLAYDGKNLWLADRGLNKIFCINTITGKVIKEIPSPSYWPMGLAWDGKYLWNADWKTGKIYMIDTKSGIVKRAIDTPTPSPRGLAWDGKYLWLADNAEDKIIKISPSDGTTIVEFDAPASDPRGLTYDGKYLWIADRIQDEIYMMSPDNGEVLIVFDAPGPFARGLAFDGNSIWVADYQNDYIYKLKIRDGIKFIREDQRESIVTFTHLIRNFGPGRILKAEVHIALPKDRDNQELVSENEYITEPKDFVTDQWGQKTAYYLYTNINPNEVVKSIIKYHVKVYAVRYFIYPDEVGTLKDIPKEIKKKYTVDNDKYQINHPVIKKALNKAVGDEQNVYWIIRKIYRYVLDHMYYELSGGWNTAPTVLSRGNGSCSEYSFVFISLCRSAGVPARYVGSVVVRGDDASMDDVFHRWVEVYMPGYGWIPIDPSGGDKPSPREQALGFGYLQNRFLITTESGGNSTTLSWYYNSNEFIETEPNTHYEVETIAEWEPVFK